MDPGSGERYPRVRALKRITVNVRDGRIYPVNYAIPISPEPAFDTYRIGTTLVFADDEYKTATKKYRLSDTISMKSLFRTSQPRTPASCWPCQHRAWPR